MDDHRIPIARQLVKVHKPKVASRLIASGTRWLTNPLAVLLAVYLQPVVKEAASVAADTQDVLDGIGSVNAAGTSIYTFDVDALHPSIDLAAAKVAVRLALVGFSSRISTPRTWLFTEAISKRKCVYYKVGNDHQ